MIPAPSLYIVNYKICINKFDKQRLLSYHIKKKKIYLHNAELF